MALLFSNETKDRVAKLVKEKFNTTSGELYFYNSSIAQPTDGSLLNPFTPATYAAALVAGPITGWTWQELANAVEFLAFPAGTAATAGGTLSWCAMRSEDGPGTSGTVVGNVTLTGGGGLLEVTNGGEGGGTGLTVLTSDVLTVVNFRLKW